VRIATADIDGAYIPEARIGEVAGDLPAVARLDRLPPGYAQVYREVLLNPVHPALPGRAPAAGKGHQCATGFEKLRCAGHESAPGGPRQEVQDVHDGYLIEGGRPERIQGAV